MRWLRPQEKQPGFCQLRWDGTRPVRVLRPARHNQSAGQKNQVQERPEIDFFLTQIAHPAQVEDRETERTGDDAQLSPPTQQEQLTPNFLSGDRYPNDRERRHQREKIFERGPENQLRRAPQFFREGKNLRRGEAKIDVAKREAIQEKGEEDEDKERADDREPANRKLSAAKKFETSRKPAAGEQCADQFRKIKLEEETADTEPRKNQGDDHDAVSPCSRRKREQEKHRRQRAQKADDREWKLGDSVEERVLEIKVMHAVPSDRYQAGEPQRFSR